ncbi:hypothetical protein LTR17_012227 [Elasticomyces elasticus]|nr:hypothetical protein LTR17_012227 [Elasticomyces elasticus]
MTTRHAFWVAPPLSTALAILVWVKILGPTYGVSYPLNYAVSLCNSSGVCDIATLSSSVAGTWTQFTVEVSTRTSGDATSLSAAFALADNAPNTGSRYAYFDDFSVTDLGPVCL